MILGAELELDARALELAEDGAERLLVAELEGEGGELVAERVHRVVAEAGDFAAAFLLDGERLEDVVHLGGVEVEAGGFSGGDAAGPLEKADPVFIKDHLANRQFGRHRQGGAQKKGSEGAH
jgi:hypothetical protein